MHEMPDVARDLVVRPEPFDQLRLTASAQPGRRQMLVTHIGVDATDGEGRGISDMRLLRVLRRQEDVRLKKTCDG